MHTGNEEERDGQVKIASSLSLAGQPVTTPEGAPVGVVVDVMLDLASGYVFYVILEFQAPFGDSQTLYPIPWGALRFHQGRLTFDATSDQLAGAPKFARGDSPDLGAPQWRRTIQNYYSVPAYWEEFSAGLT